MNSSSAESLFQKLAHYADTYKTSTCYWVQILAKGSFNEPWFGEINGKEYSHTRVYKISGDKFYELLTEQENAFYSLYKALPSVISDYLDEFKKTEDKSSESAISEIRKGAEDSERTILDQIAFENFYYYSGFKDL